MRHTTRRKPARWRLMTLAMSFALVPAVSVANPVAADDGTTGRVVVGYFANWDVYGRGYFPRDIPADRLTHLNYAFAAPTTDGTCGLLDAAADHQRRYSTAESVDGVADAAPGPDQRLSGNFNQLRKLKAAHPHLRILISLGGWTGSGRFSDIAATPEAREAFVASCIAMFIDGDLPAAPDGSGGKGAAAGVFDGIDVDWEYPVSGGLEGNATRPEDRANATELFREFRRQLDVAGDAAGKRYLLTAAIPAGDRQPAISFDLPVIASILDFINVMTYDFHGSWNAATNFDSPFTRDTADPSGPGPAANTTGTIDFFLGAGVPPNQLVVGVPFYGKQYLTAPDEQDAGLFRPFDNGPFDENATDWQLVPSPSYHDLVDVGKVVTPSTAAGDARGLQGFTRHWSETANEPWLWHPAADRLGRNVGVFISYEDPQSVAQRVQLIRDKGLRGAMVWELSHDSDDHALLNELSKLLDHRLPDTSTAPEAPRSQATAADCGGSVRGVTPR